MPPLAPSCAQSSTLTNGELFKGETTFLSGEYFFLQYSQNYILPKKNWKRLPSIKTHKQYYYNNNNKKFTYNEFVDILWWGKWEGVLTHLQLWRKCLTKVYFLIKEEKNKCKIEA